MANGGKEKINCMGVPIFTRGSGDFGEPGSPFYRDNGDPGAHFTSRMGTRGLRFRGSPFYLDTGVPILGVPIFIYDTGSTSL